MIKHTHILYIIITGITDIIANITNIATNANNSNITITNTNKAYITDNANSTGNDVADANKN